MSYNDAPVPATPNQLDTTIAEDGEPDDQSDSQAQPLGRKRTARHSRQSSNNRLSRASISNSIHTLEELDGNTRSNRSSATIRPNPPPGGLEVQDGSLIDFDFDKALVKFAAERENFLEDLSFSAGAKTQTRPPMVNPRAERIKADENANGRLSPLKSIRGSIRGSIRRKISFRDMNSSRKQPAAPRPGMDPFKDRVAGLPAELLNHDCKK